MADPLGLAEVRRALAEDRVREDATTRLLGPTAARPATARFVAEGPFVVAGLPIAALVFRELDAQAQLDPVVAESAWVEAGAPIAIARAPAETLLLGASGSP